MSTHLSERTGKGVPLIVSKYGREAFETINNAKELLIKISALATSPLIKGETIII